MSNSWFSNLLASSKEEQRRELSFVDEHMYQQLVERMLEGLLVVDNEDVIKYVNPMFCQMLDYHESELLGKRGYDVLLRSEDRERILKKTLNGSKAW